MVKIRLRRGGAKKSPHYRIVAIDSRKARDSRPLEFLGTYEPTRADAPIRIDIAGVDKWVAKGAQLSDTVKSLVKRGRKQAAAEAAGGAA